MWTGHHGRVTARFARRRWWHGGVAWTLLVLVYGPGGVSAASGSSTVAGTPGHPQILTCYEEATQFTGGALPAVGPDDIGFGPGYFPKARGLANRDPPNSGRGADLTGYKLPPVVDPGATVTMTIAPGARSYVVQQNPWSSHQGSVSVTYRACSHKVVSFPRASASPMVEHGAAFPSTCGSAASERRVTSLCRSSPDGAERRLDPSRVPSPEPPVAALGMPRRLCRAGCASRQRWAPGDCGPYAESGGGVTLQGCCTEPGGRAACMTLFTMGPAMDAPSDEMFLYGTTTATAILGSLAGAKPIIQSWFKPQAGLGRSRLTAAQR